MKDNLLEGLEKHVAKNLRRWVDENTPFPGDMLEESSEERIQFVMDAYRESDEETRLSLEDARKGYVSMEQLVRECIIAIERLLEEK